MWVLTLKFILLLLMEFGHSFDGNANYEGCYIVYNQGRFNVSFQLPINETVQNDNHTSFQEDYKNLYDIQLLYSNNSHKYNFTPGRFCQVTFITPQNGTVQCHLFPLEGRDMYHIKLVAQRLSDGKILIDQYIKSYFNTYLDGFNCSMDHGPTYVKLLETYDNLIKLEWQYPSYERLYLSSTHNVSIRDKQNVTVLEKPCRCRSLECECTISGDNLIEPCQTYTLCLHTVFKFHKEMENCQPFYANHTQGEENCQQTSPEEDQWKTLSIVGIATPISVAIAIIVLVKIYLRRCKSSSVESEDPEIFPVVREEEESTLRPRNPDGLEPIYETIPNISVRNYDTLNGVT
eukprot:TCONS_00053153-protein